jgi:CRISPR-associated protein Csm5
MNYRLTCLTPVLVGDGSDLSPIDYMVWKGQVNVLNQARILRLLAKGPRLENYLKEIKRAERLDFASWGGFAQNFAGRRIPFEHESSEKYWEALSSEYLRIPTFSDSHSGPYIPGAAIKGALRTALVSARTTDGVLKDLAARMASDKPPRRLGQVIDDRLVGSSGTSRLKPFGISDSVPVSSGSMRIYLLRTATMAPNGPKLELKWMKSPHGTADGNRPANGTPVFAEMASPETVFEGRWRENSYYRQPEVAKALRWKSPLTSEEIFESVNTASERALQIHRRYAEVGGLDAVKAALDGLLARVEEARSRKNSCVLCIGWGGGFLSKSGGNSPNEESHRAILGQLSYYSKAIRSGLPFPKTRRIVFLQDHPSTLPGWAQFEIS